MEPGCQRLRATRAVSWAEQAVASWAGPNGKEERGNGLGQFSGFGLLLFFSDFSFPFLFQTQLKLFEFK